MKNTRLRFPPGAVIIAACFACVNIGCVYFNLYYNAETAYETALKAHLKILKNNPDSTGLPPEVEAGFKKAIDKGNKVFELYPRSKKWHDKALFLVGKSHYYLGECDKAIRTFRQMQKEFPNSPFIPETYVFIGRAYLKAGDLEEAEKAFALAVERYPQVNKGQEINMFKADLAMRREGKSQAIMILEENYKAAKADDQKMDLAIKIAQLYSDLKQYDKAIAYLEKSPRVKDLSDQLYRIDYLLASCYADKGDLNRALAIVNAMLPVKQYVAKVALIRLKKGDILDRLGRTDEAIDMYKQVCESATAGDAVGDAWFYLGCIYQMKKDDLKKAKECFDKAIPVLKNADMKDVATRRSKAIETLFKFRTDKKAPDTLKTASSTDFKVGELFWLELDQPDSAYKHYCASVRDTQHAAQAPKALYSAAWIARYALADSVKADSLFKLLIARYPANIYAQKAQIARGETVTIFTRQDSAREAFDAAEKIFFADSNPDSAATAYVEVYKKYPNSDFGPKSLYAAAWINDNVLDKNRTAKGLYETLCDSFPSSSYCQNEARPRLKVVADSLAALRALRRSPASGAAAPAQKGVPVTKKTQDSLAVSDSAAVPQAAVKPPPAVQQTPPGPGLPPEGYNRGRYRGSGPPNTPAQQPAPAAPAPKPDSVANVNTESTKK
ncbi:MAG TPA: tetratricopeptide repeat protein [Chitinivibrionales bacterium]|nr:tetratricopeptide repeat protein [Chitinivibrionales bacterium]